MYKDKCKFCGEHILDCDCDEKQEWHSFPDIKPSPGQLCLIRQEAFLYAHYTPRKDFDWSIVGRREEGVVTSWRPLYGEDVSKEK